MHFLAQGTWEKLERTSRKSLPRLEDEDGLEAISLSTLLKDQAPVHTGYIRLLYLFNSIF